MRLVFVNGADGKGRAELMGLGKPGSKYNLMYFPVEKEIYQNMLNLFVPIAFFCEDMKKHLPDLDLSHEDVLKWARQHGGIRGENLFDIDAIKENLAAISPGNN